MLILLKNLTITICFIEFVSAEFYYATNTETFKHFLRFLMMTSLTFTYKITIISNWIYFALFYQKIAQQFKFPLFMVFYQRNSIGFNWITFNIVLTTLFYLCGIINHCLCWLSNIDTGRSFYYNFFLSMLNINQFLVWQLIFYCKYASVHLLKQSVEQLKHYTDKQRK